MTVDEFDCDCIICEMDASAPTEAQLLEQEHRVRELAVLLPAEIIGAW